MSSHNVLYMFSLSSMNSYQSVIIILKSQGKLEGSTEQQDGHEKEQGPKGTEVAEAAHVPVVCLRHTPEYLVKAASTSAGREAVGLLKELSQR